LIELVDACCQRSLHWAGETLPWQGAERAFADALIPFGAMGGGFCLAFTTRSPSLSSACYNEGYLQKSIFINSVAFRGDTKD